ncbi:hypothetical protein X797_008501 [Metarhizium robertsii]|uniref:Uncharacterized protein n=1 Tax=Metarhizium robertsii TaxID=568076 RepID=A0A0A1URG6_9HYPO|nr:hypothetical protein X797_008501 [Metarhizium robertsii]
MSAISPANARPGHCPPAASSPPLAPFHAVVGLASIVVTPIYHHPHLPRAFFPRPRARKHVYRDVENWKRQRCAPPPQRTRSTEYY